MNEISPPSKKTKILLFGFINLNVMDGSAVFLSGITTMFSMSPNLQIDLVLANPVQRDLLIRPLLDFPNVNVISPYEEPDLTSSNPEWLAKAQMTHKEASKVVQYYWNKDDYDWFFIRGLEVAEEIMEIEPSIFSSTLLYVTGITHEDQVLPEEKQRKLEELFRNSAYLLCQTEEMKQFIIKKFYNIVGVNKVINLNPMIPDTTTDFNKVFTPKESYSTLCYTGKFDIGWNSIPIVVAFRELRETYPNLCLDIAGDKFNYRKDHPHFIKDLKYLLENTENLSWFGAVSRNKAREIIINSDIGITWRDKSMDSSLELSTKLLEYGSLGKAVILNPTPMHLRLFGEDYPLYADSFEDFLQVIEKVQADPTIYEVAARRMFEVSQGFTYTQTLNKLLPYLNKETKILDSFFKHNNFEVPSTLKNIKTANVNNGIQKHSLYTNNNNQTSDTICITQILSSFDDLKGYFLEVSSIGKIIDSLLIENHIISIITRSEQTYLENYVHNINTEIFKSALELLAHKDFIQKMQDGKSSSIYNKQKTVTLPDEPLDYQYNSYSKTSTKEMEELNLELKTLQRDYNNLKKKYDALIRSKLGKLTVKYWGVSRKLKGKK